MSFRVQLDDGRVRRCHQDQLRSRRLLDEVQREETPSAEEEEDVLMPSLPQSADLPAVEVPAAEVPEPPAAPEPVVEVQPQPESIPKRSVPPGSTATTSTASSTASQQPIVRSYPRRDRNRPDWFDRK